jgi:hypothetical protein
MTSSNRITLNIGTEVVDITEIPPLTVGDKKALKAAGVDFKAISNMSPDDESKLVLHILRKVRATTTMDEVDALPMKVAQDVLTHAVQCSARVDSPLSPSSTPSAGTTGGGERS